MLLEAYRRMPQEALVTMKVGEFLTLADEVARERGGVARWIRMAPALELTNSKPSTLRRLAAKWHRMQLEGRAPAVRVMKLSSAEKSDWLFDEDDCRAFGAAQREQKKHTVDSDDDLLQHWGDHIAEG